MHLISLNQMIILFRNLFFNICIIFSSSATLYNLSMFVRTSVPQQLNHNFKTIICPVEIIALFFFKDLQIDITITILQNLPFCRLKSLMGKARTQPVFLDQQMKELVYIPIQPLSI